MVIRVRLGFDPGGAAGGRLAPRRAARLAGGAWRLIVALAAQAGRLAI
jgi:hypothetical protein